MNTIYRGYAAQFNVEGLTYLAGETVKGYLYNEPTNKMFEVEFNTHNSIVDAMLVPTTTTIQMPAGVYSLEISKNDVLVHQEDNFCMVVNTAESDGVPSNQ